jgi:hypothetical protein
MAVEIKDPPPGLNGGGRGLFQRVNPAVILVGMGFTTFFSWWISGGKKSGGRRATSQPEYELGQQVGSTTVTGIRTKWEYKFDNGDSWWPEDGL